MAQAGDHKGRPYPDGKRPAERIRRPPVDSNGGNAYFTVKLFDGPGLPSTVTSTL